MKSNKDILSPKIVIWFALGLLLILPPIILLVFGWKEGLSINVPIDDGKFGTFGDFFGGVLGSVWSLCGVILFYLALMEQRKDFKTNNEALVQQIEALNVQTEEFSLQRSEMELTREVSREQSKTLQRQRLDTTYFSLINLYKKSVSDLNSAVTNKDYFGSMKEIFLKEEKQSAKSHCQLKLNNASRHFNNIFFKIQVFHGLSEFFEMTVSPYDS